MCYTHCSWAGKHGPALRPPNLTHLQQRLKHKGQAIKRPCPIVLGCLCCWGSARGGDCRCCLHCRIFSHGSELVEVVGKHVHSAVVVRGEWKGRGKRLREQRN
eukprot:1142695-Pelagomonas_calceolata.AAC.7